jgi:hypothetical protein
VRPRQAADQATSAALPAQAMQQLVDDLRRDDLAA